MLGGALTTGAGTGALASVAEATAATVSTTGADSAMVGTMTGMERVDSTVAVVSVLGITTTDESIADTA